MCVRQTKKTGFIEDGIEHLCTYDGHCCTEQYHNGQTRQLADQHGFDTYAGGLGSDIPLVDPGNALQLAKLHLRDMDIVGTTETHDKFKRMVRLLVLSADKRLAEPRQNVTRSSTQPTPHTQGRAKTMEVELGDEMVVKIVENNKYDAELFKLAVQLQKEDAECLLGADEHATGRGGDTELVAATVRRHDPVHHTTKFTLVDDGIPAPPVFLGGMLPQGQRTRPALHSHTTRTLRERTRDVHAEP